MSLYLEVIDTFFHLVGPSALLLRRIFVDSVEIALEIFKKKKIGEFDHIFAYLMANFKVPIEISPRIFWNLFDF